MANKARIQILLLLAVAIVAVASLFVGAVHIPFADVMSILFGGESKASWQFIVLEARLPQTITAAVCGAALAVCGLLLQNVFRNPLADPSVFGISSGAAFGVAVVMMLFGGGLAMGELWGFGLVVCAAFVGAIAVTMLILTLSLVVRNNVLLLIVGLMVGYVASALVTVINYFATEDGVKAYLVWGMGSFANIAPADLPLLVLPVVCGLVVAMMMSKQLNVMQLGDNYSAALGINTRRMRNRLLALTGLLTAVTTALCGPVAFIGLAVPHVARLLMRSDDYRLLMPTTIMAGALTAMACNICCSLPGAGGVLPVNAVTPIVGAPVVIYIIMRRKAA